MKINWTYATKAIVSLLGTAEVALMTKPNITWKEAIALGITTILVWLVPNTTKPITPITPMVMADTAPMPITNAERDELNSLRAERKTAL